MPSYLPSEPLVAAWERSGRSIAPEDRNGLGRMFWGVSLAGWVTVYVADRLAVELVGVHPCELWPEWFDLDREA